MSVAATVRALTAAVLGLAMPAMAQTAAPAPAAAPQTPSVAYGQYMARAADCMPCHTAPGGTPFAGGLVINTPFGGITSPNITPDPDTGIGRWTDDQFYAAMHDGIGQGGEFLYPVMPFTSYTKVTREDVVAIKRYLESLKPVYAPRRPNSLAFPYDIRQSLLVWRTLFFEAGTFQPNPARSADWNRGAYLVQGAGHCGECHSPRNMMGATERSQALSGGVVDEWRAPNISSDKLAGLGTWSMDDIVAFLRGRSTVAKGVAFGPMQEVVHDSLGYLTDADVRAIAVYLKDGPDQPPPAAPDAAASARSIANGKTLYANYCAMCHQDNGRGISGAVPNLAGNAVVVSPAPNDVILVMLNGLQGMIGNYGQMPRFAGALSDRQIADIANYVRTNWANKGVPDAVPSLVAALRAGAKTGLAGTEAARAFDCPAVGNAVLPNVQAQSAQVAALAGVPASDLPNRVAIMVNGLRQQSLDDPTIATTLFAAYCPVVANRGDLDFAGKRAALAQFNAVVQDAVGQQTGPQGATAVVAPVTLPIAVMNRITAAATAAKQTPAQWMANQLTKDAK